MKKKQKNLMCKFIIFKGDEKSTISKERGTISMTRSI